MSTWLITGCSTGLGRALAEAVIGAGHNAVVTARDSAKVADLAGAAPERVLAVALDVTDPAHVTAAVCQADERFGGVDVLVNNAGYGYRGAIEEGDDADVRELFETHFFGGVAMIKARDALEDTDDIVVLAIPLLTAQHRDTVKLRLVVVVDCPTDIALERLLTQRGMDRADAEARIAAQISREERIKEADYVLDNSGDRTQLEAEVSTLWEWLVARA